MENFFDALLLIKYELEWKIKKGDIQFTENFLSHDWKCISNLFVILEYEYSMGESVHL